MDAAPIRFQRPSFPAAQAIEGYLAASRERRWFSNAGPCWELLRDRLSAAAGREAVPVVNATLGLLLAVAALREQGPAGAEEALVPSFAFVASAQAATWNGLRPVFVDVCADHWHLDPDELDRALHERGGSIAVVIALSSFGVPPPSAVRRRWQSACVAAGVPLIVDSAAGYGAIAEDGCPIGAQGDIEVVSFHATKPMAAGEGGAVFCRDRAVGERVRRLTNFGFDANRRATSTHGINAKMSEPIAAIALAALDGLPEALRRRRAAAAQVIAALPDGFVVQAGCEHSTWQFVPVRAPSATVRDAVVESSRGSIEIRTYYDPLHEMHAFADCARLSELPVTRDLSQTILSLPMAVDLSAGERRRIAAACSAAARSTL